MPPRERVLVDDVEFRGWKSLDLTRSVLEASGQVTLQVVPEPATIRRIGRGARIQVKLGDQPLLTGFVDARGRRLGGAWTVTARDTVADMVDASPPPGSPRSWSNAALSRIAHDLAEPFGIKVIAGKVHALERHAVQADFAQITLVPFPVYAVDEGGTAWDALEPALREIGVLAYAPGDGSLLLTPSGRYRSPRALVQGENVRTASYDENLAQRFSAYYVKGFDLGDEGQAALAVATSAGATDKGVRRNRPLVVVAERVASVETARLLAQWEATVRAAESEQVVVEVPGWDRNGTLPRGEADAWLVNELVSVSLPAIDVKGELLISGATYSAAREGDGTTTKLTCVRANAFEPNPAIVGAGILGFDEEDGE